MKTKEKYSDLSVLYICHISGNTFNILDLSEAQLTKYVNCKTFVRPLKLKDSDIVSAVVKYVRLRKLNLKIHLAMRGTNND